MSRSKRQRGKKDDASLRRLTKEVLAWRQATGVEARPHDFHAATELFKARLAAAARREPETIEVSLLLVNGQVQFEPSDQIRARGNELWVDDKRIVVNVAG